MYIYICLCLCMYVHIIGYEKVQNRTLNSLELELHAFVEYLACCVGAVVQTLVPMITLQVLLVAESLCSPRFQNPLLWIIMIFYSVYVKSNQNHALKFSFSFVWFCAFHWLPIVSLSKPYKCIHFSGLPLCSDSTTRYNKAPIPGILKTG